MKKLRRLITIMAIAAMTVAGTISVNAASDEIVNEPIYPDVPIGATYFDAVNVLSDLHIISGFDDGTFRPDNLVTRAEITKMIVEALNEGEQANQLRSETKFWDVSSDHWASGYINQGVNDTFISGYNDYEFGPSDNVTFVQAQKMLVSAIGYETFAQGSGGWPNGYKTWAASQGITSGMTGLADDTQLTRADVAKMIYNTMDAPVCIVKDYETTYDGRRVPNLEIKDDEGEDYQNLLTKRHDVYKVKGYLKNNNTFVVTQADNFDDEYYPNGSSEEVNIPTNYSWNGGSQVVNNKYYGSEYLNVPCTAYLHKGKLTGWGIMYLSTGNVSNVTAGLRTSENKVYYQKGLEYADADDNTNIVSTNDNKTYYEFKNPDETIKNAQVGDVVVIKPCSAIPSGLSVKVKRIEKNGNSIRIYKDDLKAEEVISDIDIAQSVPVELQYIDAADGVEVEELSESDIKKMSFQNNIKYFDNQGIVQPMLLNARNGQAKLSRTGGLNFKIKYNANGYKVDGTVKLLNPKFTVDMKGLKDVDCNFNFVTSIDVSITKKTGKEDMRVSLGQTHFPVGTTGLFVDLEWFLDINASGQLSIKVEQTTTIGMKDGKKANSTYTDNIEVYADAKASAGVEIGMGAQVSLLETLSLGVEGAAGLRATAALNTKKSHLCDICIDGDVEAYLEAELYLQLGYGKFSYRPIDVPGKMTLKGEDFYISIRGKDVEFGFGECPYQDKNSENSNSDTLENLKIKVELEGNKTKYLYRKDLIETFADFKVPDNKTIIIEQYGSEDRDEAPYGAFRVYEDMISTDTLIAEYTGGYKTRNYAIVKADGKWYIQQLGALSGAGYYTIYEYQNSGFREVVSYSKDHQEYKVNGRDAKYEEYEELRKHYNNVIASTNDDMFKEYDNSSSQNDTKTSKSAWYPTCPSCGETDMFVDPNTGLYICRHCDYIEPDYDRVFKCPDCGSYNIHCLEKSGYIYARCYDCDNISKYYK